MLAGEGGGYPPPLENSDWRGVHEIIAGKTIGNANSKCWVLISGRISGRGEDLLILKLSIFEDLKVYSGRDENLLIPKLSVPYTPSTKGIEN